MKRYVKLIMESLIDDEFNDIYGDDILNNEISDIIKSNIKASSIKECNSKEEIFTYIIDKYNIFNDLNKTIDYVITGFDSLPNVIYPEYNKNIVIKRSVYNSDYICIYFKKIEMKFFVYKKEEYFKENNAGTEIYFVNALRVQRNLFLQTKIIRLPLYNDKEFIEHIKEKNLQYQQNRNTDLYKLISDYILNKFHVDRIYDEISCTGKVYHITQKDLDRMDRLLSKFNRTGFNAIKDKKKLITRIAAAIILCNNKQEINNYLNMTDEDILGIMSDDNTFNNHILIDLSRKILDFPDVHIKDIIESYKAYKEKTKN